MPQHSELTLPRLTEAVGAGSISMMARPIGRTELLAQMQLLVESGYHHIVSLLEPDEARKTGLALEAEVAQQVGLRFTAFPIPDYSVPESVVDYRALIQDLHVTATSGQHVIVHCFGGVGRSSLVVAGVLVQSGTAPEQALQHLTTHGNKPVPETAEQREWFLQHATEPKTSYPDA
ncbi:MAG: tyrosine protein phosphatase [Gammaproteobacteria bacterium]|nr:tyrosine protein phosphatase [Gammaproteobacteria bacterium]